MTKKLHKLSAMKRSARERVAAVCAISFLATALLVVVSDFFDAPARIAVLLGMTEASARNSVNMAFFLIIGVIATWLISMLALERKESEAKYATLVEHARDGIAIVQDGIVVYSSPAITGISGYRQEELMGKPFFDFVAPADREQVARSYEDRNAGRSVPESCEIIACSKDGRQIPIAVDSSSIIYRGKPAVMATVRDITERKRAEEALRIERENFRNSLEMSPLGAQIVTKDGELVYANRALLEIWGYGTFEELKAVPLEKRVTPETFSVISGIMKRGHGHETATSKYEYETCIIRKDGRIRRVQTYRKEIVWNGNESAQILYEDITERREAEERIERAAKEWRTTFDSITDLISIHDANNRLLRVNRAYAGRHGVEPRALIGRTCHELMHGATRPPESCPHQNTLRSGKAASSEVYDAENGVWVQESTSPIFDDDGRVVATVHIMKDITERKQLEQQMLMTERLATIGELVAGIAHELNNPLTGVIGFSQLLMERQVPEDVKEDLSVIASEAQRAARIVKNLLTFARKHAPVKQPSQVNSIVEDVLRLRAYEHRVNNIEVVRRLSPDVREIMADYFQIQQVFLNIIINAEYFMVNNHGKGTLTIVTEQIDGIVRASFTDDGPGIAPDIAGRIFDPFFTTKEVGRGTGLGLSICHGIVTEHGGRIYARSEPGKGATFVVELPLESSAVTAAASGGLSNVEREKDAPNCGRRAGDSSPAPAEDGKGGILLR